MAQDGGEDEDYFAHFGEFELTEEDLARIDSACEVELCTPVPEPALPLPDSKCAARVTVEVEQEPQSVPEAVSPPPPASTPTPVLRPPFDAFRSGKFLSVSDLIGPLWCELQYEYRQRQGWGLKVKDRPQTFVSREGNTIAASHSIASNNENILKAGRVVHRRLEREIRPPQVRVHVETLEEHWATRLINMVDCLLDLEKHKFCREMPVFGITHDHTISGIIDEISIEIVKQPTDSSSVADDEAPQWSLHVSDTKTRDFPTIPSERNSIQARTQLMMYHRLLSGVVQPPSDLESMAHHLDFDAFWLRVGVDPHEPFSDQFCEQTGLSSNTILPALDRREPTTGSGDTERTEFCLNTLVHIWKKSIQLLGITSVDPTLTLNYRRRATSGRKKRRRTNDGKGQATISQGESELSRAIIASLAQAEHEDPALVHAIAESLRDAQAAGSPVPEQTSPRPTVSPSKRGAESDPDKPDANPENPGEKENGQGSELIGSTSFVMDDVALDSRLGKVLEWWHGSRQPQGVELEDTGRCHTCEFSSSCEWREKKSNEFQSKLRSRTRDTS